MLRIVFPAFVAPLWMPAGMPSVPPLHDGASHASRPPTRSCVALGASARSVEGERIVAAVVRDAFGCSSTGSIPHGGRAAHMQDDEAFRVRIVY